MVVCTPGVALNLAKAAVHYGYDLKRDFALVRHIKPPASRADSSELYVLATGYRGAEATDGPYRETDDGDEEDEAGWRP